MIQQTDKFLSTWACGCTVVILFVATLGISVDPYMLFGTPRMTGFNARKPAAAMYERVIKPYDVIRFQPKSIILGSSRTDFGLNAQYPAWPLDVRPVYNLALAGGLPYVSYRHLQHVLSRQRIVLVVMGLEFELFIKFSESDHRLDEPDSRNPLGHEERLAVTSDGLPNPMQNWQYAVDAVRTLSLESLRASLGTVNANLTHESWDMVDGNLVRQDSGNAGGAAVVAFSMHNIGSVKVVHGTSSTAKIDQNTMMRLQSILELCESYGVRVILFISPMHADVLEIFERAGLWPLLENWKRELTAMVAHHSDENRSDNVILWDFSGYNSLSTESVALSGNLLRTYWDPYHYKRVVGDTIIRSIFGVGAPEGAQLMPENIESHLHAIRMQQRLYREFCQVDSQRIRDLYDLVAHNINMNGR